MNEDVKLMLNIYETYDMDWMGDEIKDVNLLTRHHIVKKEKGGENGISNYALLTEKSHHLLNYLEENDVYDFNIINRMLLNLNRSLLPPTKEYYQEMSTILKKVRKNIKNKRRGR